MNRIVRMLHRSVPRHAVHEIKMPALSPRMEKGLIVQWQAKEGEKLKKGDTLLQVETEKATLDIAAQSDGRLVKIQESDGEVPVGSVIGLVSDSDEDAVAESGAGTSSGSASGASSGAASGGAKEESGIASAIHGYAETHATFPSAVTLLLENEVDPATITPTGYKGMITKGDVLAALGKIGNARGSADKLEAYLAAHRDGPVPKKAQETKAEEKAEEVKDVRPGEAALLIAQALGGHADAAEPRKAAKSVTYDDIFAAYGVKKVEGSSSSGSAKAERSPRKSGDIYSALLS